MKPERSLKERKFGKCERNKNNEVGKSFGGRVNKRKVTGEEKRLIGRWIDCYLKKLQKNINNDNGISVNAIASSILIRFALFYFFNLIYFL